MEIGSGGNSIETTEAFGISGDYDMDALMPTIKFKLPYLFPGQYSQQSDQVNLTQLKKYDTIKLYFGEFTSDPGTVTTAQLTKIFDGYIESIHLTKTKESVDYEITGYGTAGLCNSRSAFHQVTANKDLKTFLTDLFTDANIISLVPLRFIDIDAGTLGINVEGGQDVKKVLDSLKERYAFIITQSGDGYLNIFTPSYLLNNRDDSVLGAYSWAFDTNERTVFEIDYGDLTSNVNATLVAGYPPTVGIAVDTVGVENNDGKVNYQSFERYDLFSDEDCQLFAREKLLELQRNYLTSFKTKFDPRFMVGQPFTLNDHDKFTGNEIFTIKKLSFTIDKQDVSCQVSGFTFSLITIPEDIALSNTGILDVDIIPLNEKTSNAVWGDFN